MDLMSLSLPIDLDRSSVQPLYRQIEHWIRHAIDGGRLPPGTRLPGVRTLARDLGVSVVPVITAYEQLGADGYLETRIGLGTMVAAEPPPPVRRATPRPGAAPSSAGLPAQNRWVPDRPTRPSGPREPPADGEVVRLLARSWSRHLHRARQRTEARVPVQPGDEELGLAWLRAMLAVRAGLSRADAPLPDQLVVTAGVQAGLAAVARTWLGPDRTCALTPGYPASGRAAIEATGARILELDLEDDGRRLGPPRSHVDLVVVAPTLAGADGTPMTAGARRRLLDWAARVGAVVLEDDRERELLGDRAPTLGGMDTDGRVIGLGTIPAGLAPGAALGYLVVPAALHGPVAAMVLAGGQAPGLVEQEALAGMLESGDFERDLRRLRDARLRATVTVGMPQVPVAAPRRPRVGGGWTLGPGMRLRNKP